jgi:hypothetical protein
MTNPTSNFGWQMPTPTDLVTDLPADFEVFGQAVDTSMADLKGGTTGQILSKATNADMDFTWITNDIGDITAVNVTAPITGGGSSGAVTIGVNAASTSASGVVQLSDSTSTTSSVLASTPTATKSAYDLANTASTTATAAIPKSTVTTAGDVIYATGSSAVTRLGIGTTGQVLTVNGGGTAPSWATPAASGGWTLTSTTALSTASTSLTIPSGYKQIKIYVENYQITSNQYASIRLNSVTTSTYRNLILKGYGASTSNSAVETTTSFYSAIGGQITSGNNKNAMTITLDNYENTTSYKLLNGSFIEQNVSGYENATAWSQFVWLNTGAITSLQLLAGTSTWAGGTAYVYGVK